MSGLGEAIELAELDSQFALQRPKGKPHPLTPSHPHTLTETSGRVKNKRPSVLDSKKAYNICECDTHPPLTQATHPWPRPPAILLSHLKLPTAAIREAVLSCDHSILGEQHLRLMASFAPDKREVSCYHDYHQIATFLLQCLGLARYHDNTSVLSLPDQFSCEVRSLSPFHTVVIP